MTNSQNSSAPQSQSLNLAPLDALAPVVPSFLTLAMPGHPEAPAPAQGPAGPDTSAPAAPGAPPPALNVTLPELLCAQTNSAPRRPRNGKIAHLPKLQRDLVNRMLANNLAHARIVSALDECGVTVTVRNISNWKTRGGYKECCAAQARALELRNFQDSLTDFLRRHDASDLPEVGLQSAATSLSTLLLRPDLMRDLAAAPEKYAKLIEIQCRLAREIQALQKNRDEAALALGRRYNPERLKRQDEAEVEEIRETYSSKTGKSPRDPDVPHRNFISQPFDPAPPVEPEHPNVDLVAFQRAVLRACPNPGSAR